MKMDVVGMVREEKSIFLPISSNARRRKRGENLIYFFSPSSLFLSREFSSVMSFAAIFAFDFLCD